MTKWIKCTERMPEKDGRYLVNAKYSSEWIGVSSLREGKFDDCHITHWMDLPKAPQDTQ